MKLIKSLKSTYCALFVSILILVLFFQSCATQVSKKTTSSDFNLDWSFHVSKDSVDVSTIKDWRRVNLPHDWVVEKEFDSTLAYDAQATGYLNGEGYGYYKKVFDLIKKDDEVTYVLFDGVYNNSEVWLNGKKIGFHPYGYSPFYFDLTPYLNDSGNGNELLVKIDHSRYADSRWYTGAGIYRKVDLITRNKTHIPVWGTFITTPVVSREKAEVQLKIELKNDSDTTSEVAVVTKLMDSEDNMVASMFTVVNPAANSKQEIVQSLWVENPKLWSVNNPNMYKAVTSLIKDGQTLNKYETPFGIRNIRFDADTGFYLNGENMKIKGVCLHHDAGLVGAAVPKGVWKRRLQILRDGGCNAIRVSHNPASSEFLDLCDEMGFLVQDEFFDEWDNPKDKRFNKWEEKSTDYITRGYGEHFQEWAKRDLENTMLSHRNHPSIIQWSIGNEIEWTYPRNAETTGFFDMEWDGNYFWSEPPHSVEEIKNLMETLPRGKYDIGKTAQKLANWTRELDTTRPIVANCILPSSSHLSGYADALDIVGYSYRRVLYDYGHENYPDKVIMGTENLAQYHEWKAVMERPHISGTFLWTGIDYMGEIRAKWPVRVQPSGLLTTAGFKKGSYHMMKTLWSDEPHIHIATQNIEKSLNKIDKNGNIVAKNPDKWKHALWEWQDVNEHWNYKEGEMISIEIYSNLDELELFLNDTSLGKKKLADFEDHIYKWGVPFADGELKAIGTKDGKEIIQKVVTVGASKAIQLDVDTDEIEANYNDVVHVVAQFTDEHGNPSMTDDKEITFEVKGPAKLLGVDNGWKKSVQKFQTNVNTTHNGKTLLIVQATGEPGTIEVIAHVEGMEDASVTIQSK